MNNTSNEELKVLGNMLGATTMQDTTRLRSIANRVGELATIAEGDRVKELEDLLTSAHAIVKRQGEGTAWGRFSERLSKAGIGSITPRVFKVLPSDCENAEVRHGAKDADLD
jgi:hypothetical protein